MDAQHLSFPDDYFNSVLSFDVLEHLPDVDTHLKEVGRVLKKGGYYLMQTPNKLVNIPFSVIKDRSFTAYRNYHCSLKTFWSLRRLFVCHGFEFRLLKLDIRTPFVAAKLEKYFGRIGRLLYSVPIHKLPSFMQTNFYVVAQLT